MRICKITNIKPDGKPWESKYGLMYPFYVILEDGGAGTVNSKTEIPSYKVGDSVGYDVTGSSPKGVPKLKITRNPNPGEGTLWTREDEHPDLEAQSPVIGLPVPVRHSSTPGAMVICGGPHRPPTASGTPINGQTVGMAVKLAGDLLVSENKDFIAEADWAGRLRAAAAQIIAVSRSLENGTPFERVDQELPPF